MAQSDVSRLHPDTLAVVAGRGVPRPGGPLNVPVHFASAYHPEGEVTYAREGNPSWSAFEDVVGALEGGHAVVFASGLAAVSAVLEELAAGAVVVAPRDAYTGTREYLHDAERRGRLGVRLVDVTDTEQTLVACDGAAMVWLESPTNPLLGIADIAAISDGAKGSGCVVIVDNTFATPLLQRPLQHGADLVVHSASKFLAGHSDVVMGVVVTRDDDTAATLVRRRKLLGAAAGPMEVFLALRGLRSLPVRLQRAQASAEVIARRLADDPRVEHVRYPGLRDHPGHATARRQMDGFGAVVSFELADGPAAERVCAQTALIVHTTSLGGVETTMERRRRHAGEDHTPDGLIRLSVGCEHVDDLWRDLEQALDAA